MIVKEASAVSRLFVAWPVFLPKMVLEQADVLGVASPDDVDDVAGEGNQTDAPIDCDIAEHFIPDWFWEAAINLAAGPDDEDERVDDANGVANSSLVLVMASCRGSERSTYAGRKKPIMPSQPNFPK